MRDPEKYIYIEIALPKDNPAVQRMLAEAERLDTPLRVLVKTASINAYSDDDDDVQTPRVVKPKRKKAKVNPSEVQVSDNAFAAADSFLDDNGF